METLRAGDSSVTIDHEHGGRLSSFVVAGHELLVGEPERGPMGWGSFVMAPWAGRIRHGRFDLGGRTISLPLGMPPHAIHGTAYLRSWTPHAPGVLSCRLGPEWPWPGTVHQRVDLGAGELRLRIRIEVDDDSAGTMPVTAGWHPWFRRKVGGADLQLSLPAGVRKWRRDAEGIPDGTLVDPGDGPWDDCFTGLEGPIEVSWPGVVQLRVTSIARHVVVYDEPHDAACVEPQSAPPDAHNSAVDLVHVTADQPFECSTTWSWDRAPGSSS